MTAYPKKVPYPELKDQKALQRLFPGTSEWSFKQLSTLGYSGANFTRLTSNGNIDSNSFILKELKVSEDWFSKRSGDTVGREAAVLLEPALHRIHEIFELPYVSIGMEHGKIRMLMKDISHGLFPDERRSISQQDQDLILDKLAEMHAFFWEDSSLSSFTWLHQTEDFLYLMGPLDHQEFKNSGGSARNIQTAIKTGWKHAENYLSKQVEKLMYQPPKSIISGWGPLPKTLVHGDTKVANFALANSHQLHLLDWAFAGHAPCTFDIGWFMAVNATRLHDPKETVLLKYRNSLEAYLPGPLDDELWTRLENAGILCGAFMLLWSKATAIANRKQDAEKEWDWWIDRLEKIAG